jgi:hypothetical protein
MRIVICFAMLFSWCALASGQTTGVVLGTGSVYVNGMQLSNSLSVAAGDVIQTRENSAANVTFAGSMAGVESNSIVRLESEGVALDRGSMLMGTAKGLSVFARDFKITPASSTWTQFYVARSNGMIQIMARTNNLVISCGAGAPTTLKEGQQLSREDSANCGLARKGRGAPVAATKPILNSTVLAVGALGAGGGLALLGLAHGDDPVSPDRP